jgi:hypothetical protein
MKFYKITGPDGEPLHGGSGNWELPVGNKLGKWMPKVENVAACNRGYHLVEAVGIVEWLPQAPKTGLLWEAEGCGAKDKEGTKTAFAQARLIKLVGVLDEVSMRLAAADMAERVLPIFYKVRPNDDRPALAIQATRDFACDKIGDAAQAAARDAARAAAEDAARYAARASAQAAAWAVAQVAAGAAARASAQAAAGAAAWDAAQAAAWDAAQAAAWAVARAANAKIIITQAKARRKAK